MTNTAASPQQAAVATALLVSSDASAVQPVVDGLKQFAIAAEVCDGTTSATHALGRHHFEAVIVDLQLGDSARELLQKVRLLPSSHTAATFAITSGGAESASAFTAGSHFVLERPLSGDSLHRSFKAAYGMIMRERRRYFRCPVTVSAVLRDREGGALQCKTLNISESGMAVISPSALKPASEVNVQFSLPDHSGQFMTDAKVIWSDGHGRAGLQFLNLPGPRKSELQGWLARRLEEILPESVASQFQKS